MNLFNPTTLKTLGLLIAVIPILLINACSDDDENGPQTTGTKTTYMIMPVNDSGVSGTASFDLLSNDAVRITITLSGTSSGGNHPSHIHMNSAAEGGGIALDLTNVDGASGMSVTDVTELNDGTPITYNDLIAFDGYINVHNSPEDLGTFLAQGDIGQNALTGNSETYTLDAVAESGISGEVTFAERVSGATLITISLQGDSETSDHPAHIHMNSVADGGGIVRDLTNVVAGSSKTHVEALNDETAVTYTDLIGYNGHVKVHKSSAELQIVVSQGNIGSNSN